MRRPSETPKLIRRANKTMALINTYVADKDILLSSISKKNWGFASKLNEKARTPVHIGKKKKPNFRQISMLEYGIPPPNQETLYHKVFV